MDDNKKQEAFATTILGIVVTLFAVYYVGIFFDWFVIWIQHPKHIAKTLFIFTLLFLVFSKSVRKKFKEVQEKNQKENEVLAKPKDNDEVGAVYCGKTKKSEPAWIKPKQRSMHTQIIGTTNAGKTESVILPWAIQDINQKRGLILIDGKADSSLLEKLWSYVVSAGREDDFRLFSLSNIDESHQFNPLIGGSAEEISERVFNSFEFENPYYKSLQYEVFSQVMRIFEAAKAVPTFAKVYQAISNPSLLEKLTRNIGDKSLRDWALNFKALNAGDRAQRTSGLMAAISHFSQGTTACLFNAEETSINLNEALENNQIIYFQLPVLRTPFLGKSAGRMILQSLQSAVSNRHKNKSKKAKFFSVFLDDFSEYLYPGFVSILNKSRSANIGVVFAHQALGDIKTMGDAVANSILTNANLKIFMRGNDPESAEYFSRVIGTEKSVKYTERTKTNLNIKQGTGDASAREVDEFTYHPNKFKRELGVGEAIMIVPHDAGSKVVEIKFDMFPNLGPIKVLSSVAKPKAKLFELDEEEPETKSV